MAQQGLKDMVFVAYWILLITAPYLDALFSSNLMSTVGIVITRNSHLG